MKIAMKEVNETSYWLTLCEQSDNYPPVAELKQELDSIFKITSKIIASSKNSLK
jgi:four helix bundle protein